jgi:hypothetical protein
MRLTNGRRLLCGGLYLVATGMWVGCLQGPQRPRPPQPEPERKEWRELASECSRQYLRDAAKAWRDAGAETATEDSTAHEFVEALEAKTKPARIAAYVPLRDRFNAEFGGVKWRDVPPGKRVLAIEQIADGIEEAGQ